VTDHKGQGGSESITDVTHNSSTEWIRNSNSLSLLIVWLSLNCSPCYNHCSW